MRFISLVVLTSMLVLAPAVSYAANEGQEDLDKAIDLQLNVQSLADLEKVVSLAESALTKGLEKDNAEFARQLLAATLFQHANRLSAAIFEQTPPSPRWPFIRKIALADLEKARKHDPKLPDTFLLIAKLQILPDGDEKAASEAIDEAVRLLKAKDNSKAYADALVLRAQMTEDMDAKFNDFDAAVKADPRNTSALQARALMYLEKGENEKATADLQAAVELQKDNPQVLGALAEVMTNLKKYDEALKLCDQVIKLKPQETLGYNLRARVHVLKDDLKSGIEDLNQALKINPEDLPALLMRSGLLAADGKPEDAKADVEKALRINPNVPQSILMKSRLAAQLGKFGEAISDVQTLLRSDPKNADYRLQLALYLQGDKRPRRALEVLNGLIDDDSKDADLYRTRGDVLLSVNKHAEAIADYEAALKIDPEDTGVLNNLAWVLATSETESVRDSKRSIELATKACELTKYEKAHILSTLASGYAEKGDFETAIKWSTKAVELGEGEVKDQLKKELESYKEKKPWREAQNVEENTKPLGPASNDLET
ncbi:TPR repeat-containing protein YrrB [Anatilimnocola aggregata]|uniref:TPR repeat-containing protein YrrB n=1 Tax=Anatilimnocola aggregata TaxID=2528021 RepID=A0A517Y704_9BACT|nr:tetratricopeptide repeat protein [Anatilimnocola aggregata]QDU26017.1 TPR repeat-containing protein YrrB [Anatilimnocola aggregata]